MSKFKITLLLFLTTYSPLFGQDNPFTAQTAIQNVFAHINTTQIPTGYLQEYAVPLIPMNIFNGVLSDSYVLLRNSHCRYFDKFSYGYI